MTKDDIIKYQLDNEKLRYEHATEFQKTIRHTIVTLLICLTLCACFFMYFVVPVEEESYETNTGNQIVVESEIGKDNTNGR